MKHLLARRARSCVKTNGTSETHTGSQELQTAGTEDSHKRTRTASSNKEWHQGNAHQSSSRWMSKRSHSSPRIAVSVAGTHRR